MRFDDYFDFDSLPWPFNPRAGGARVPGDRADAGAGWSGATSSSPSSP